MATIYTNRNDNTGTHTTVNPNTGSTWVGGIVPATTDDVYIVGRRTTVNMAAFIKWTGTKTITVASTTNFASAGFFYTVTDQSQIVKINYTSTTPTTFVGCTVDESDSFYSWTDSGIVSYIQNSTYIHNPAYVVTINTGETFECNILYIQEGGWVLINGGTLKVNTGIYLRDGRLVGRGNGNIIITRNSSSLANIGFLNVENYQISILDIDGGENRVYSTLASPISIGDGSIQVSTVNNGTFAIGDEIAIYDENDYRRRNRNYTGYRDATMSFKGMDEGLNIVGVDGDWLYVGLRNGTQGFIKSVVESSPQQIVEVKPKDTYFNAGDKIVIENNIYTIDSVEDSEFTVYDYDFTNPATSLSDFWVNASDHIYSAGWQIYSGIGIGTGTTSFRELTHKYFWEREVVIEAEMSPLDGYTSGTRGTGKYGIQTTYDPSFRWGHRGDDVAKTDYFQVNDASDYLGVWLRNMGNYTNNRLSRDTALLNATRIGCTYKIDTRKGRTITYINGSEFSTDYRRDGNWKGTVGLVSNNDRMRCKRLTIKIPTQKLYITTNDPIPDNVNIYLTGIEIPHAAGRKVVKISSHNTGNGNHTDLAFAYRGQNGNGEWPLITQLNGTNTVSSSFPYLHNHDTNADYYYDLGNAQTAKSITIDLLSQKTFTHVSFVPRMNDYTNYYGYNGVAIYGSNDSTNWTTLYGPTNDTKKWFYASYNRIAYYPTGTVSYRYVKFETKGAQVSPYTNRYINIGVHNFSDGYTIDLNNASDFNIGDKITVSTDGGYSWGSRELEGYYAWVDNSASNPENFWHGGWLMECTITNKVGSKIYLDRPVFWGYLENENSATIIKTNRNFNISGTVGPTNSSNDWRWPNINLNQGSSTGRINLFKNTRFQYIGSYRYTGSTSHNRGIINGCVDYWNSVLFDGISYPIGQDQSEWGGIVNYPGVCILRNSVVMSNYTGVLSHYYNSSYIGSAIYNNKFIGNIKGIRAEYPRVLFINYNEVAMAGEYPIHIATVRTERNVQPWFNEVRRNSVKGTSYTGFYFANTESTGSNRAPRIKIEDNKVRGTDDYSVIGQLYDNPYVNMNSIGEHPGCRLSRYRNEGHVGTGDTTSDLAFVNPHKNYGRYGYDLIFGTYYILENDYSRPEIQRFYTIQGDAYYAALGIELEVLKSGIPIQINVQFQYRYPWINRLQDDGTDDGRIRCYSLQHGTLKEMKYGVVPSTMTSDWYTFNETFTVFAQEEGRIAIYLNKVGGNGYFEIKSSSARVLCDSPTDVRIIGNTFNFGRLWDQHMENRDIKPLTSGGTRTLKTYKLKL